MSISPPSDIVLDVARAADPARYKQAVSRLDSSAAAQPFREMLQAEASSGSPGLSAAPASRQTAAPATPTTSAAEDAGGKEKVKTAETYRRFEAMALASMLESSMKGSSNAFFGDGVAGDTWKSLLIEQIADQMSKAGGIGIATQLARSASASLAEPSGPAGPAARSLIVGNLERAMLRNLEPEEPAA